jgi:hypothetical protein
VDPKRRTVTVHHVTGTSEVLRPGDTWDGGTLIPGFCLSIAEIFL